jgi:hypothetical protein
VIGEVVIRSKLYVTQKFKNYDFGNMSAFPSAFTPSHWSFVWRSALWRDAEAIIGWQAVDLVQPRHPFRGDHVAIRNVCGGVIQRSGVQVDLFGPFL